MNECSVAARVCPGLHCLKKDVYSHSCTRVLFPCLAQDCLSFLGSAIVITWLFPSFRFLQNLDVETCRHSDDENGS
jgi:hypothetical protein